MSRALRLEIVAVLLILAAGLVLRLVGLDAFIAADELRWTCRSIEFREALRQRDWAGTFRVGHPGVVTLWLGALFMPAADADVEEMCRVTGDLVDFHLIEGTPEERTERLAKLPPLLFQGRVGVALFTWLNIAAIYLLVRLLWGRRVALLSLGLVAWAPFFLAHSRVLHIDAVLAGLMTLSVLCLLVSFWRKSGARELIFLGLSGAAGGLAILQKSPALFLVPFTALILAADALRHGICRGIRRETLLRAARALIIWGLAAGVVYVALWPVMWSHPADTIKQVLGKATDYAEEGHTLGSYFLGQPVHDPGWLFYPVTMAFRLDPLTLAGSIAGLIWAVKRSGDAGRRFGVGTLLLYSALYGVFMSLGAKKFDRYLLPVYPALGIIAGIGLSWLAGVVQAHVRGEKVRNALFPCLLAIVLIIQENPVGGLG
jgi:4-amino-4-deoxy-L-arabinose transferase-like glycosyltransferase